jgi:hypothetical protein
MLAIALIFSGVFGPTASAPPWSTGGTNPRHNAITGGPVGRAIVITPLTGEGFAAKPFASSLMSHGSYFAIDP